MGLHGEQFSQRVVLKVHSNQRKQFTRILEFVPPLVRLKKRKALFRVPNYLK